MIAGVTPGVLQHRPVCSIAATAEHSIASPRPSRRSPSLSPRRFRSSAPAAIKGMPPSPEFAPPLLPLVSFSSLLKLLAPPTQFLKSSSPSSFSVHPSHQQRAPLCCVELSCDPQEAAPPPEHLPVLALARSFSPSAQVCLFPTPSFPFRKKVSCRPQSASPDPPYPPDPRSVSPDPICSTDPYPPRPRAWL